MDEGIARRIQRRTGISDLPAVLAEKLSPGDLQSLLLEVYARRARRLAPADLLERQKNSRFCQAAPVDPRQLVELEQAWLELLDERFETLVLSPLAPLGCCSALGPVHQNKVLSTARNLEVAADPSNQLALECALRRAEGLDPVHLSARQRVVRTQALPGPNCFAHFCLLALASASSEGAAFQQAALALHLRFHLGFLQTLLPGEPQRLGWSSRTPLSLIEVVEAELVAEGLQFESCGFEDAASAGYYPGARFKLWAGEDEVGDGGFTDWCSQLLGRRREKLLISGLGLERIALARKKRNLPRRGG